MRGKPSIFSLRWNSSQVLIHAATPGVDRKGSAFICIPNLWTRSCPRQDVSGQAGLVGVGLSALVDVSISIVMQPRRNVG